jgi:hypothetical protein
MRGQFATYGSASLNGAVRNAIPADVVNPPLPDAAYYAGAPVSAPTLSGALNTSAQEAAAKPWDLRASPVPWLIIGAGVGLAMLKFIHWG